MANKNEITSVCLRCYKIAKTPEGVKPDLMDCPKGALHDWLPVSVST
jgi:hypothetical protein